MCAIYRNGYYINWTETYSYILSKRVSVDKNTCSEIVSECINVGLFDRALYDKYGILTSHGIQIRYLQASERRAKVQMIKNYTLLSEQELPKNGRVKLISCLQKVYVDRNDRSTMVSVAETTFEHDNTSAKIPKVKESKVNNDDVDDTRARAQELGRGTIEKSLTVQPEVTTEENSAVRQQDAAVARVFSLFSDNIHPVTGQIEADKLSDLLTHYGERWTTEAIKEAALYHATTVKYIETTLESWERNGFKQKPRRYSRNDNRKQEGEDEENGRATGAHKKHYRTPGLAKLAEDMRRADANQVYPWEVQSQPGGTGGAPQ